MSTTRFIAQLAPLLLLLGGCGTDSRPVDGGRLIILGFDGMDPVLAERMMEAGKLPNFSRLAESGHFQPLATSNPPQSPVAWSTFATGLEPGHHGIYDFLRRNAESYAPAFSISETVAPDTFGLFGLEIPLGDAEIRNRRVGEPFWSAFEAGDRRATVLRVPVTFPPDPVHRMLSGMGVPDLLGTQGTYTLYSTRPLSGEGSGSTRVVRLRPYRDGRIETRIEGPEDPFGDGEALSVAMTLRPEQDAIGFEIDGQQFVVQAGGWSPWVRLEFSILGPLDVTGLVRFHVVSGYPEPRVYMSPIQIDPEDPAVPLSSPSGYAAELAERIGLYHTIGMPEETWSLNEGHLSDEAFLQMEQTILAEREAMLFDALQRRDSELVIGVFVQTDRISHMFYRGIDPEHPLHGETDERARNAIDWIYGEADRIVGRTLEAMGPEDRLLILSDHGFAPFRRAVHLNRWLIDAGYLTLRPGFEESSSGFQTVDWSSSRAYALGLNGIYLNLKGRERDGIVTEQQSADLKREISEKLAQLVDPDNGASIVRQVFDGAEIYAGNANGDAPDLVAGYQPGYRASWQTTLGGAPPILVEDNDRKWSGDHCMDPEVVPGVLFTSFKPEREIRGIGDIADWVLAEAGR